MPKYKFLCLQHHLFNHAHGRVFGFADSGVSHSGVTTPKDLFGSSPRAFREARFLAMTDGTFRTLEYPATCV